MKEAQVLLKIAKSLTAAPVDQDALAKASRRVAAKPVTHERVWDLMEKLGAVNDEMGKLIRDANQQEIEDVEVPTYADNRKLAEVWDALNRMKIDLKAKTKRKW